MFHCTKRSSRKVKEKVDFKIHFHATQVPHTAWDKLAVSVIPIDTGRVTGKTRKVPVRHGQCHWPDAVSETAKLILDTRTLQYDERLYKFVVAKGFSRSGVLGEVIINLAEYVSAVCPTSVTLPLRFCYAGTVLHVTIQCLTPKTGRRPSELQRSSSKQEDLISDEDTDFSGAGTPFNQCHSGPLERPSNVKYNLRRSIFNNATGEASRIQPPSPTSSTSSANGHTEKKKSPISYISLASASYITPPPRNFKEMDDCTRSFESVGTFSEPCSRNASSLTTTQDAPKCIEADSENAEVTIEETHKEALQWKDYAQKLQDEIEMQKEQFMIAKLEFDIEKTSLLAERDRLKFELQEKMFKQDNGNKEHLGWDCEAHKYIIEELKEGLSFEKEANSNLNIELCKMRDSNMELLLVVRDLEDSLEMQSKLLSCKNNLDSEGANLKREARSTDSSIPGEETMDKTIDKIINLDCREDISIYSPQLDRTEEDIDEKAPSLRMFISGFSEDLNNMGVLLNELDKQPDAAEYQNSTNERLPFNLKDLVKRSQTFITELQKQSKDVGMTEELFFQMMNRIKVKKELNGMKDNIVEENMIEREKVVSMLNDSAEAQRLLQAESENGAYDTQNKSLQLQEMEAKVLQLQLENGELNSRLKGFLDHEEVRKTKMEQLEAQLWEFAEELDYMHASNENFESIVVAMKTEKEQLEQMAQNTKQESKLGEMNVHLQNQSSQYLSQRLSELEAQVKSMEEEKDAYVLERCVSENLARDLCEQLQTLLHKADGIKLQECQSQSACEKRTEQRQDFICHVKELRALFADLLKARQELEDQIRELQCTCTSLEDRMMKEHGELMATISSLDAEFGQLSRESDQMLSICNREIEMLVSTIEQEHKYKKTPGFVIEENACEIAYLRDELQRLKEQTAALLQENGTLVSQALVDTEKHQAEKMEWCEKIAKLQERLKQSEAEIASTGTQHTVRRQGTSQCDAPQLETSLRLDPLTMELGRQTTKDEIEIICELEHIDKMGCNSADLKTELRNLKEQNLKTEKIKLDSDLEKLNTDHGKFEELNASSEQELLALKAELEQCNMLKCSLEEQVTCFQTKLQVECGLEANARNECIQLRKENQDLKCDLRDCNLAMDKLEGELLNLQKRMETDLNSLAIELDSSNQVLHERELLLLEKMGGFEVAYEQTTYAMLSELEKSKHAKTALQANIRELELEVEAKGALEAEVQTECLQLRQENEELKCRISECNRQNENATMMLQNLQNIMTQLEIDLNSRTAELEFLNQEAEEKQVRVQSECLQLRQENEGLKCTISEWKQNENATKMLQAEVQNLQNILTQLEMDLNSRTTELEFLKQEAEEKQVRVQTESLQLRQEIEELKCRISEWKQKENATMMLQAEVQNLQNIMTQLEVDLNSRTAELEFLKQESEEKQVRLQTECLQLKKQNENAIMMLHAEVQNLQNIMTQLEIDLNSRTTELEFLKQEAEKRQIEERKEAFEQGGSNDQQSKLQVEAETQTESEEFQSDIGEFKRREETRKQEHMNLELQNRQNQTTKYETDISFERESSKQEFENREASLGKRTETSRRNSELQTVEAEKTDPSKDIQDMNRRRRRWSQQQDDQEALQNLRVKFTSLEAELNSKALQLNSFIEKSREREAILCEKIVHLEQVKRFHEEEVVSQRDGALNKALAEIEQCKHVKAVLEENISRLDLQLQTEKALEAEKDTECARLRHEIEELKLALSAQKNMVTRKEEDIDSKALEMESIKLEFQEREASLWKEIEYLEMANEQLAVQQVDSGADQLKQELTRLQTQNSELTRRQYELMSKLSTYELLQLELQRLQEANEQLEQKLLKIKEASLWGDALERLIYLETELAEALETNNMYKLQLQGVFAEQHNVQTAGHAEEIIGSLVSFKKQTSFLESELKEMQERYLSMSMRFAEIQAEREELIMTVKALRCARRGS